GQLLGLPQTIRRTPRLRLTLRCAGLLRRCRPPHIVGRLFEAVEDLLELLRIRLLQAILALLLRALLLLLLLRLLPLLRLLLALGELLQLVVRVVALALRPGGGLRPPLPRRVVLVLLGVGLELEGPLHIAAGAAAPASTAAAAAAEGHLDVAEGRFGAQEVL